MLLDELPGDSEQDGLDQLSIRQVTDPRALRAMAHPLRLRLYELITREGTLTTTRASELVGQSTASCSFHLRQLAKYGFIEMTQGRDGRERPWRRTAMAFQIADLSDDAEFAAALGQAVAMAIDDNLRALSDYVRTRHEYPQEWRDAALVSDSLLYLTVDELGQLRQSILDLTRGYLDRTVQPQRRPAGSRAVGFLAAMFPKTATGAGG